MSATDELKALKPTSKGLVYDLVEQLGYDVTDWRTSASRPNKMKANPKYCYEWSFLEPGKVAIFNLWHDHMEVEDDQIVYKDNFRENANYHRTHAGRSQWIMRAERLDRDVAIVWRDHLPVRVIVVDGPRRRTTDPSSRRSHVEARQIDPVEWHVGRYESRTGEAVLVRGAK